MARDILREYGPESPDRQASRATSGGVTSSKPLRYAEPQGPTSLMKSGPGLHGSNSGNTHQPNAKSTSGGPGLHGETCCVQGKH